MVQKQYNSKPQNARRKRGFERAVTLMGSTIRKPAERRGFAETKVLTHWEEIVGPDLAEMSIPVKIQYGRGMGGTLVLLTNGASAPIVQMQKDVVITRVNACYGYAAIKDVVVTQTAPTGFEKGRTPFARDLPPAEPPKPDPERLGRALNGIENVQDPTLREALTRLAGRVVTRVQT